MAPLDALIITIAFVFGAIIGSFLNVLILRIPDDKSLLKDSACPNCGNKLGAFENVPIISWIFLRGKCRKCKAKISAQYPIVELFAALAFGFTTWIMVIPVENTGSACWTLLIAILYLISVSIVLFVIDIREKLLPDSVVLPSYFVAGALLVASKLLAEDPAGIVWIIVGAAISFSFYLLLALVSGGIGGGDIKLAGVLGMYLGFFGLGHIILGTIAAFILGGIFALGLVLFEGAKRKSEVPFGPWMLVSAFLTLLFGTQIIAWYVALIGL